MRHKEGQMLPVMDRKAMHIRVLGTKAITDVLEMKGQQTGVVSGARRDVVIFLGPSTGTFIYL